MTIDESTPIKITSLVSVKETSYINPHRTKSIYVDSYTISGKLVRRWTEDDIKRLKELYHARVSYDEIAKTLNRTPSSVRRKVGILSLWMER